MKRFFSLVEMLVVIGIIAILAGLAFPVIGSVQTRAKEAQAGADCKAIAVAVSKALTTYGKAWGSSFSPFSGGILNGDKSENAYDAYLNELSRPGDVTVTFNTRKIAFLDPKPNGGEWKDPWGNRYIICVDTDYDNKVTVNGETLHGSVFVYSRGVDKDDNKDDIKSWK